MIKALIFDFDGLILDTEGPVYQSWEELYRSHGLEFTIDLYAEVLGTTDTTFDLMAHLQEQTGREIDTRSVEARRRARELAMIAERPVLPGIEAYLQAARQMELGLGVASSSSCDWVNGHLKRLGLLENFQCIVGSDDVDRTKPDPALFLKALDCLGAGPKEAVVFEDSPRGIEAANRAGIFCVAVPNPLSRQLDLSHADLRLDSLEDLPLRDLLRRVEFQWNGRAS